MVFVDVDSYEILLLFVCFGYEKREIDGVYLSMRFILFCNNPKNDSIQISV